MEGFPKWRGTGFPSPCIQLASIEKQGPGVEGQGPEKGFSLVLAPDPGLEDLGAVAQLGERLICIQEVAGSIPTSSTRWEAAAVAVESKDGWLQLVHTETGAKQGDGRPSVAGSR